MGMIRLNKNALVDEDDEMWNRVVSWKQEDDDLFVMTWAKVVYRSEGSSIMEIGGDLYVCGDGVKVSTPWMKYGPDEDEEGHAPLSSTQSTRPGLTLLAQFDQQVRPDAKTNAVNEGGANDDTVDAGANDDADDDA